MVKFVFVGSLDIFRYLMISLDHVNPVLFLPRFLPLQGALSLHGRRDAEIQWSRLSWTLDDYDIELWLQICIDPLYIYIYVYIFISKYIYILYMYIYIYIERGNLYIHNLLITSKHLPLLLLFRPFLVSMKILHFPENPWRCSQRWLDLERVLQEPSWERSHGTHQAGSWDNHRPKSAAVCRGLC